MSFRERFALKIVELGVVGAALFFMWDITKEALGAGLPLG